MHPHLPALVRKHQATRWRGPIADHSRNALQEVIRSVQESNQELVLDLGCGVGESTVQLAKRFPEQLVLGVDKSALRVSRSGLQSLPENAVVLRADSIDTLRLVEEASLRLRASYVLYPNPWPKKKHIQRRWHGHPLFPLLCQLSDALELRTNWSIYAQEFYTALEVLGYKEIEYQQFEPQVYISPFERKYAQSKHSLFRVAVGSNTASYLSDSPVVE